MRTGERRRGATVKIGASGRLPPKPGRDYGGDCKCVWLLIPAPSHSVVQYPTKFITRCVIVPSDVRESWLSRNSGATVRALVLPPAGIRRLSPPPGRVAQIRVRASRNARGRADFRSV